MAKKGRFPQLKRTLESPKNFGENDSIDDSEIINTAISRLLSDVAISHPRYCPQLKSEKDCEELERSRPLISIWNEDVRRGTFSVSIHRDIVEEALSALLDRNESRFSVLRGLIIEMVEELATATILACWKDLGDPPSVTFSSFGNSKKNVASPVYRLRFRNKNEDGCVV